MLTREAILAADDLKRQELDIPEWGDKVFIQMMTAKDRDSFEETRQNNPYSNLRAAMAIKTVVDQDGKRLFTDDDLDALGAKCAKALSRVFNVAIEMNHFTEEDVQELEKNSDGGQSDSSGTS